MMQGLVDVAVVFPAHAGINRHLRKLRGNSGRVPRARRDQPTGDDTGMFHVKCSPRTQGSTGTPDIEGVLSEVFPAHAGINRYETSVALGEYSVPRARRDQPVAEELKSEDALCSPRTQGSTDR